MNGDSGQCTHNDKKLKYIKKNQSLTLKDCTFDYTATL